jgi:very-short-patch-repair endonuclease
VLHRKHNKKLTPIAKTLRKNMTPQERHLWYDFLHNYKIRILHQKVIDRFVVDFYCRQANLVIEIDGGQHFRESEISKDKERTKILNSYGLKVIRFTNSEIDKNFEAVCATIDRTIQKYLCTTE